MLLSIILRCVVSEDLLAAVIMNRQGTCLLCFCSQHAKLLEQAAARRSV